MVFRTACVPIRCNEFTLDGVKCVPIGSRKDGNTPKSGFLILIMNPSPIVGGRAPFDSIVNLAEASGR